MSDLWSRRQEEDGEIVYVVMKGDEEVLFRSHWTEQEGDESSALKEVVSAMVDRIVAGFQPLRVILFGSHARGTATARSDVDLLVVLPNVGDKREAAVAIRQALGDLLVSKDIMVTTPDEIARRGSLVGTVLRVALREGKIVYERP